MATNPFAPPSDEEQYAQAARRLAELEGSPVQMESIEPPKSSMLDAAAPYLVEGLRSFGPSVLPGRGHQLANIGSVLAQGFLGGRASLAERRFQDYDRRRKEAREKYEAATKSRSAEVERTRETASRAASDLSKWRRESGVISDELAPYAPGYKAGDRVPASIYNNALDAANKAKEPKPAGGPGGPPKSADLGDYLGITGKIEADKGLNDFRIVSQSYSRMNSVEDSAAGDMALVFSLMKMLDPNSVVRETEYANAQNAAGVPDRIRNTYNKIVAGEFLTPDQRADFRRQASRIYRSGLPQYESKLGQYRRMAARFGIEPSEVIPDYTVREPAQAGGGWFGANKPKPAQHERADF